MRWDYSSAQTMHACPREQMQFPPSDHDQLHLFRTASPSFESQRDHNFNKVRKMKKPDCFQSGLSVIPLGFEPRTPTLKV